MKFACSKNNLLEAINIVQKAISTKTTMAILDGILLECIDNKLKLTGNDLEIGIESVIEADVFADGSIVLNSKMFGDIVRRLPDSEVVFEVKENNITFIDCENSHFELMGNNSEVYPAIPSVSKIKPYKTTQKVLREMIKQTIFSVGDDDNRPILKGSLIESKSNELIMVAIDGYRLALRKNNIAEITDDFRVVVPGKTLNELVKIFQSVDDEVFLYTDNRLILFDIGKTKIVSRLIEGEYLNYESILPKEFETKIRVKNKDLLSSLERASLITLDEKKYPVKFTISEEEIVISSNTNLGNVREKVSANINGNEMEIGFNPKFLIDAIKIIDDEEIEMFFTSNVGPCTIKPIDGESFTYMVLPVRISND